jgi:hypothetical protein
LPNRVELNSIADYSTYDPSIDPIFSIGAVRSVRVYWSSTTFAFDTSSAHGIDFYDGLGGSITKSNSKRVRAVRSIQNGSLCPIELIYGKQSARTKHLRHFRDTILSKTSEGQELIKLYYQWSPVLVKAMEEDEEFRQEVKGMIDSVVPMIGKDILAQ